jgi:Icc-related predicted phosphoesterase
MRITLISDTHTKHWKMDGQLPGGDLLIHAGDIMNSGYNANDIFDFCKWYDGIDGYVHKIFIAGNHDRMFEDEPEKVMKIVNTFKTINYLEDSETNIGDVKIYGTPWQPEFYSWAFNLPRCGQDLMRVWNQIPKDTTILITHGPPQDHLDVSGPPYNEPHLGCELLRIKVDEQPPKIHLFGHIHGGYGYKFHNGTHFFNASVLNERYEQVNKPITFDWNSETNEIEFI